MASSSGEACGRFQDKVVIVTGGSKGIGKGCVQVFVENGAEVVFCSRGVEEGRATEAEVNATGPGQALFIPCDVTKEEQIQNVVDRTIETYGRLDCLINNAGYHPEFRTIDDFTADDLRSLFNLNVVNYFLFAKFSLPHLRKTNGSIINDSSLVAEIGQAGAVTYVATKMLYAIYSSNNRWHVIISTRPFHAARVAIATRRAFGQTKGAITAMTKALAVDEARYGVRVNSISPGNVWTPLWAGAADATDNPGALIEGGKNAQLNGRFGTIRECGEACLFLAAEGQFCTGIDLKLSGGAELNYGNKNRTVANLSNYD